MKNAVKLIFNNCSYLMHNVRICVLIIVRSDIKPSTKYWHKSAVLYVQTKKPCVAHLVQWLLLRLQIRGSRQVFDWTLFSLPIEYKRPNGNAIFALSKSLKNWTIPGLFCCFRIRCLKKRFAALGTNWATATGQISSSLLTFGTALLSHFGATGTLSRHPHSVLQVQGCIEPPVATKHHWNRKWNLKSQNKIAHICICCKGLCQDT